MEKNDFLAKLRAGLTGNVAPLEVERLVTYYDEMIADLMEDGVAEQDAVAKMGEPNEIVFDAVDNAADNAAQTAPTLHAAPTWTPHASAYPQPRHTNWLVVIALIISAPLWGSIGFAALCVLACIDLVIWCIPFTGAMLTLGFGIGGLMALFTSPIVLFTAPFMGVTQLGLALGCLGVALLGGWLTYMFSAVFLKLHHAFIQWVIGKFSKKVAW